MVRLFFPVVVFIVLSIMHTGCDRTANREGPVTYWDSLHDAGSDTIILAPLRKELQNLVSQRYIDSVTTSYLIIDDTEEQPVILASFHPDRFLIPASVQKLLVTGAALEILGEESRPDVLITNLQSHNGKANKLLQQIGKKVTGTYSIESGARSVIRFWESKGIDMGGVHMVDGSGRRYDNLLSARQLADVLYYQTQAQTFGTFYPSLPLAGISGTMKKTLKGTIGEGRVRAKTGTLASVKSLAGYVSTVSGRKLIFVLLVNNYTCNTRKMKSHMESILIKMTEL